MNQSWSWNRGLDGIGIDRSPIECCGAWRRRWRRYHWTGDGFLLIIPQINGFIADRWRERIFQFLLLLLPLAFPIPGGPPFVIPNQIKDDDY
jgi:hypothetical protein